MKTFLKILNGTGCVLLCIIIGASAFFAPAAICIREMLLNYDSYGDRIVTDEYVDLALEKIREGLEGDASVLSIDVDAIMAAIDRSSIKELAEKSVNDLAAELVTDEDRDGLTFESDEVYAAVRDYLAEYADANSIYITYDDVESVYNDVCSTVALNTSVSGIDLGKHMPSVTPYANIISNAYFAVAAFVVAAALLFILKRKNPLSALYCFSISFWSGAAMLFIPALLWKNYDFPSRLVLGKSLLREFVSTVVYDFTDILFTVSASVFAAAAACAVASIIIITVRKNKNHADTKTKEEN